MVFPLIGAIASIGSAYLGYKASQNATKAQTQAYDRAAAQQQQQYDRTYGLLQPRIEAGDTARGYQLGLLGLPGGVDRQTALDAFQTSPGYEFRKQQGLGALDQSATAGGALYSGKAEKDRIRFGQDYASNEFGNYYNRLGGISGAGDTATGTLVNAGQNNANSLSSLAVGRGDAQASGYINGANAIQGGIQNLSDLYAYYNPPRY